MANTIIKFENIKDGNCQFNSTSAKSFRSTLAKWHDATFKIADELLAKNDRVKALRTLIDSNKKLMDKLANGESIIGGKTADELQHEIDGFMAKIEEENKAMSELRDVQKKRMDGAENLVPKTLHEIYERTIDGSKDEYVIAIAQFLADNGIEPCRTTIDKLIFAVGKKVNSARNMCKTGKHNGAFSFNQWRKIFLGELCDIMGDALPLYKFTYVLKDKREKKSDK